MLKRYFDIEPEKCQSLLAELNELEPQKWGIDRRAYLMGEYAVLKTSRLKLRNVDTRDDDLSYFNEIIGTIKELYQRGVNVVPILGYLCDESSSDGDGYIIQRRAKGRELYDDALLAYFEVWAQKDPDNTYLSSAASKAADKQAYISERTHEIAAVPQFHFDKFISDMIAILDRDILVDCNGKSNFFYDAEIGFQFIDLDAHSDYKYGLLSARPNVEELVAKIGFVPCHFDQETRAFAPTALAAGQIRNMEPSRLKRLKQDNTVIFEKCKSAMRNNGIADLLINRALEAVKIFGAESF